MGRYFFHLENSGEKLPDNEGAVLAGAEEAKEGAIRAMRAVARRMGGNRRLVVEDDEGRVIHSEIVLGRLTPVPPRRSVG